MDYCYSYSIPNFLNCTYIIMQTWILRKMGRAC